LSAPRSPLCCEGRSVAVAFAVAVVAVQGARAAGGVVGAVRGVPSAAEAPGSRMTDILLLRRCLRPLEAVCSTASAPLFVATFHLCDASVDADADGNGDGDGEGDGDEGGSAERVSVAAMPLLRWIVERFLVSAIVRGRCVSERGAIISVGSDPTDPSGAAADVDADPDADDFALNGDGPACRG